jgi:hypothetical protein
MDKTILLTVGTRDDSRVLFKPIKTRLPPRVPLLLTLLLTTSSFSQAATEAAPSFVNEGTINAPVAAVWNVWTTSEGYMSLGVAKADVDFKLGGLIRSHYSASGTLGDEETIENTRRPRG